MRELIVKMTVIAASVAALAAAAIDASTGTPWLILAGRAGLAFAIVGLAGWITGFILMRTVLRRRYEQWRLAQAEPRPRARR